MIVYQSWIQRLQISQQQNKYPGILDELIKDRLSKSENLFLDSLF
jgi:hypothetical protein